MEASERDSTQDWLLPEGAAPPLLSELEQRIDEALAIARASEAGGDDRSATSALDAARQARRAAELAERASAAALEANRAAATRPPDDAAAGCRRLAEDASLRSFSERADRVVARLRALEGLPRRVRTSSAAAGHRRPGG